jgi:hypothetical protein
MTIAHAGVSHDDPRNQSLIEMFRPSEYTPMELQARIEAIAARVNSVVTKARMLERAAKVSTTQFRPPPPLCVVPGAFSWDDLAYAAHPNFVVVIRQLNSALPEDCLCLFWGRPALVHPRTGIVFAVAIGSIGIAARIPSPEKHEQASSGRRRRAAFDLLPAGPEWTFIDLRDDNWIGEAYEHAGRAPMAAGY